MSIARSVRGVGISYLEVNEETNSPVEPNCVGLASGLCPEAILHLATDLGFMHVCQKDGHEYDKDLAAANQLVGREENLMLFPVASILSPDRLNLEEERRILRVDYDFDHAIQKRELLSELTKSCHTMMLSQTLIDDVIAVADEMFTNAVYNAPFVDVNTQKNLGMDRQKQDVRMDVGKKGRLFLAQDDTRLLVGCTDPYGSLDLKRYLNKINATYTRGPAAAINYGPGGAGIGSYIIFNAGSSLYFGVWPGRATIICCVIPLGLSNRKRIQLPKHLHWIQR